jgi:hypothetical protein
MRLCRRLRAEGLMSPHGHNKNSLRENDKKDQRSHYAVESATPWRHLFLYEIATALYPAK